MRARTVILAVMMALLVPAGADAATRYGGGTFSLTAKDAYTGSYGVSLAPTDDGNAALRIDAYLPCRKASYRVGLNWYGPFDRQTLKASGTGSATLVDGRRRLTYRWSMRAGVSPTGVRGKIRVGAKLRGPGRRVRRCSIGKATAVRLLPYQAAQGTPVPTSVGQRFYGLTGQFVAAGSGPAPSGVGAGIQGSFVGASDAKGRMGVRFTLDPRCPAPNVGLKPTIVIYRRLPLAADGTFTGSTTYTKVEPAKTFAYTTTLTGQVLQDAITGTAQVSVLVTPKDGSPAYTCDSGTASWSALRAG